MSQRSEPHGMSDSHSVSSTSSNLSSMPYNPPSARPYGRTLSNNEFSTSVTLPFRRSVKTYDRPNYNLQTDYSPPSSTGTSSHPSDHNFPTSGPGHSSSIPHHHYGGIPHRSNSVMARYTGSSSSSVGGATASSLDHGSGSGTGIGTGTGTSSPYNASRYTRSLSRARTTPDQDLQRYRDFSIPRQTDPTLGLSPAQSHYNNSSRSGEGNGWVGGSTSSSTKTAAATAKMTTQEKMNSYQNYYQSLNENPVRRFQQPESPAAPAAPCELPAFHEAPHLMGPVSNGFTSHTNSAFTRPSTMYETSFVHGTENHGGHDHRVNGGSSETAKQSGIGNYKSVVSPTSSYDQRSKIGSSNNKFSEGPLHSRGATPVRSVHSARELSSPPGVGLGTVGGGLDNSNVNKGPTTASYNNTSSTSSIPKWPNITIKTHRPVNVVNFNEAVAGGTNFRLNNISNQSQGQSQHQSSVPTCSSPPVPAPPASYRVMSPPPLQPPHMAKETYPKSPPPTAIGPPLSTSSTYQSQSQKLPKRDSRATSVEKITRFLERRSMSRDRVISPPPPVSQTPPPSHQSISVDIHVEPGPLLSGAPPTSETLTVESDVRSTNSSPVKVLPIQKTNSKPKFLQSLEKKWEKLTTTGTNSGSGSGVGSSSSPTPKFNDLEIVSNASAGNVTTSSDIVMKGRDEDSIPNLGKPDSESLLLQRAVSPEKKPKAKFGASTVNFMLGKFRRIEETSTPGNISSSSKIPAGRPPLAGGLSGPSNTRIGRRVQSVYAGACSDSVLTLPRASVERDTATIKKDGGGGVVAQMQSKYISGESAIAGAGTTYHPASSQNHDGLPSGHSKILTTQQSQSSQHANPSASDANDEESKLAKANRLRRPLSLGIFSNANSGTTATGIPRFNRQNVAAVAAAAEAEHASSNSPNSTVSSEHSHAVKSPVSPLSHCAQPVGAVPLINIPSDLHTPDDHPLTPTSPTDSFDSSSICSEKTEMSVRSVLDDEESVSDRIFRKSFYPRFNSLDRKKSSSVSSSSARHYSPNPMKTSKSHGHSNAGGTGPGSGIRASVSPKVNKKAAASATGSSPHASNEAKSMLISHSNFETGHPPSGSSASSLSLLNNKKALDSMNMSNGDSTGTGTISPDSTSSKINKYNPNPLFKELITDEFKSDVGRKAEYSRRVTSKLSKLLREIESDIGTSCSSNGPGSKDKDSPSTASAITNKSNKNLAASNSGMDLNSNGAPSRKSVSPSPGRIIYDVSNSNSNSAKSNVTNNRTNTNNRNDS